MTQTIKERLVNALIAVAIGLLFLTVGLQIGFKYTRDYHNSNSIKYDSMIKEFKSMIQKQDTLLMRIERIVE